MWPFRSQPDSRKFKDLEERLANLERELKAANLDWDDLYERMRRMMARTDMRARVAEKARAEAGADAQGSPQDDGALPSGFGLDPVSRAILARRNRALAGLAQRKGGE